MHLVQILLPLYDQHAKLHERSAFDKVVHELSERFGGATLYARAPATGLWKQTAGKTERDDIVVCEVMVEALDAQWWARYRRMLEQAFGQEELVVRAHECRRL
jgi:hypothetical protein